MINTELFAIYPDKLRFPFELKKHLSCSFYLANNTDNNVAFKVKTTNPRKYSVKPNSGIVLPRSPCEVVVTMLAQEETPSDMQCNDKFMIRAVIAGLGVTREEITETMFSKQSGRLVEETKLGVAYVDSTGTSLSNDELLTVEPLELKFPVVSKKTISQYIFLTNKTKDNVAYKIVATNPRNYLISSGKGVVRPWSPLTLRLTKKAQEEGPSNMQRNDKFIVQAIASPGITSEEVTYEMFSKEAFNLVEETTLRVTYVSSTITSSPRTRPFLTINPRELIYHYYPSEDMRYHLFIENKTDNDIAIKLTSENPTYYLAGLGKNVVRPRSTLIHKVVLGARSYDRQFKDKIIVQAVTVSPVMDKGDITEEMFRKESGHIVEETTLDVKFFESEVCIIL